MRVLLHIFIFLSLSLITQLGGIVYLLYLPVGNRMRKKLPKSGRVVAALGFFPFYLLFNLALIPLLAQPFGRVPLPWLATENRPAAPHNWFYPLANRHYVRPPMKATLIALGQEMREQYPGLHIQYLDANFPLLDGFPLLPHLSHDDGRKVDLAFVYHDKEGGQLEGHPSWFGYGYFEGPRPGEGNQPAECARQGYWQYGLLGKLTPAGRSTKLQLDRQATRRLLILLARQPAISRIFLEPHLRQRWGLAGYSKIRYHGCHAVRHDDHLHVELSGNR